MALNVKGDTSILNPVARPSLQRFTGRLDQAFHARETKTYFRPFETYRSPIAQRRMFTESNATGRIITKADAWHSAHQYGLAADFVPYMKDSDGKYQWSWDEKWDWDFLPWLIEREFKDELYMEAPGWDKPHVTHVAWLDWRTVMSAYK